MTFLLSFPFRLTPNGTAAVWEDGSDDYYAEELAVLIMTKPGERVLVPDYGLEDPTFGEFDEQQLAAKVGMFGPPILITDIHVNWPEDGLENIRVTFDTQTNEEDYVPDQDNFDTDNLDTVLDAFG